MSALSYLILSWLFGVQLPASQPAPKPDGVSPVQGNGVCAWLGPNLVRNGDFSAGAEGFYTEYEQVGPQYGKGLIPEGTFAVASDPSLYHPAFRCPCKDPSYGQATCDCPPKDRQCDPNDLKLYVNGAPDPATVWEQTVYGLIPGQQYQVEVEMDNLIPGPLGGADPYIRVLIDGSQTAFDIPAPECPDGPIRVSGWFVATAPSVLLTFVNLSLERSGNDFSLDNISLRQCQPANTPPPTVVP